MEHRTESTSDLAEPDITGVVAHALLNSMAVVSGTLEILREGPVSIRERQRLVTSALVHGRHVSEILMDLTRGLPPAALEALDALGNES